MTEISLNLMQLSFRNLKKKIKNLFKIWFNLKKNYLFLFKLIEILIESTLKFHLTKFSIWIYSGKIYPIFWIDLKKSIKRKKGSIQFWIDTFFLKMEILDVTHLRLAFLIPPLLFFLSRCRYPVWIPRTQASLTHCPILPSLDLWSTIKHFGPFVLSSNAA